MILFMRFLVWLGYHTAKLCGESWGQPNRSCGYTTKRGRLMLTWLKSDARNEKVLSVNRYRIYKNGYMEGISAFNIIVGANKWEIYGWKSPRPVSEDTCVPHS
jgi:hypothetical protein